MPSIPGAPLFALTRLSGPAARLCGLAFARLRALARRGSPRSGEVFRFKDLLHHGSSSRGSMLPSVSVFGFASPTGFIGWPVRHGVVPLLIGSALHRVSPPVSQFKRASSSPRLVPSTTMASADFPPPESGGISPGKSTLLRRTAAAFTSRGIPDAFGVLCHLDAPCRPCMRFLSIGSRLSPSLPSPGWLPFPSWLQMVVSSFFS